MKNLCRFILIGLLSINGASIGAPIGYAVLVGVVKAGDPNYSDEATAGCADDVQEMFDLLVDRGFDKNNIIRLTSTNDTRPANILQKLATQIRRAGKNDLFVFYFSGHGTQKPEPEGQPTDEPDDHLDEYLVGFKGDINDDRLADIWQSANPRARLVVILDACHSGRVPKFTRAQATPDHPALVPVSEYASLAGPHIPGPRTGVRSGRSTLRAASVAPNRTVTTRRLTSCLFQTIDPRPNYQLIYYGAVLDEDSAIAFPNGKGEFTLKLVSIIRRIPSLTYRQLAHEILAGDLACSSQSAYAEIGPVAETFLNSFVLQP